MSETRPDEEHAKHTYQLLLCDEMRWIKQVDESAVPELKAVLREKLREQLARAGGSWCYDLEDIARKNGIRSLHEIPELVHRALIQKWLDRINATRGPKEQLFLSTMSSECCYRPPHLWYACTKSQALTGADAKTAVPWAIEVVFEKIKQRIPITIGAGWTCEITRDGRAPKDSKDAESRAQA